MISISTWLLVLACVTLSVSDFSLKGDQCSKHDSCSSKSVLKTCSCESDCHEYGTCCQDVSKPQKGTPPFHCYDRKTVSPVFVKRSCSDEFRGHVADRLACLDEDVDEMDVRNNLLMTSHKTKVTYWNKHCALCNNEVAADLEFWNVEVFCPSREEVSRSLIRTNLTFDHDKKQWGLMIGQEFLNCAIRFSPPLYISEVKYCTANMIDSCPVGFFTEMISKRCSQYYAERKVKNSDLHFKNVHCAMCNGANIQELECPGLFIPGDSVEESDFHDMVEEIFTNGEWLDKGTGKRFECSPGFIYDPGREKCRRYEIKVQTTALPNSAHGYTMESLTLMVALVSLLL